MINLGKDNIGEIMKKILSYLIMSLLFFNILFLFYYYFKIVTFLYIDLFDFYILVNTLLINVIVTLSNIFFVLVYKWLNFYKLSYFKVVILGLFIGGLMSLIFLRANKSYEIGDYLAVISYFVINTVFISYSLSFDKDRNIVFE